MSNMSITIFYNNSILSYLYYIDNFFVCMVQISTHDSFNFSSSIPYEQLFLCMVQISTHDSFNFSSSVPYEQLFLGLHRVKLKHICLGFVCFYLLIYLYYIICIILLISCCHSVATEVL